MQVEIPNKFSNKKELADFYGIAEKTASNLISDMRQTTEFSDFSFYRLSGRVWLPAFDEFLLLKERQKYR
ncbi:hypothetical protein RyT2_23770 [Pseudolactococcus yaeyamensis]